MARLQPRARATAPWLGTNRARPPARRRALGLLLAGATVLTLPAQAGRPPVTSLLEMRQDRVVVQQWDLSCGAAALATVLNYQHGETVTEKEVALGLIKRKEYVADPEIVRERAGFSLFDLKRYVGGLGYEGAGFGRMALGDLLERAPVIVPVNFVGYNHFVVFRGLYRGQVLLADPAWGNRTMPSDKFVGAWIDYPRVGRVAFLVKRRDGTEPPDRLVPKAGDFVFLPP